MSRSAPNGAQRRRGLWHGSHGSHGWQDEVMIAVALIGLAATLALGGWAWRLDRVVYDLALTLWSRPPPPGIVIVAIDDASVEALGRWPWARAVHATLLERLALARPRAVALDLVLSEPDPDPRQDRLLAEALGRAAPVVLPMAWQPAGFGTSMLLLPAEPLRPAARLGVAEAAVDADGVLRHAFLYGGPTGSAQTPVLPYPHLALALMQAGGEPLNLRTHTERRSDSAAPLPATAEIPTTGWRRDSRLLIRYAGPPGTVERVSYADVLRGAVPAERLTGRYVLVGMTAQGLGDTLATPVNGRHQAMPGIEVLANTLYTLRSGDTIEAIDDSSVALLSAALLSLLVFIFGLCGPRIALPAALLSVPVAVGASLLALSAGWWLSPVPYALAALLAYPLWSWRRLERAVSDLDREITRLDAESIGTPAVGGANPVSAATGDALDLRLQALQRAGALVREARRFLADLLATLPTAMLVADEQGCVLLANPKAARLFDVEAPEDLAGLDLPRLLGEFATATRVDWVAGLAGLSPAGPSLAVEGRLADARDYVIQAAAVDLLDVRRLVVTIADVEPVKQAQREREEVLAFVSHDLRSPASSIVLLADLNLQGRLQTPHDELLIEMRRLAARTLEMSEDFVRAAQVRTGPLVRRPLRLDALMEDALADLRAQALSAGVALHVEVVPLTSTHTAPTVEVDRLMLLRAIGNLVSNAIKHSPRDTAIEVRAERCGDGLLRVCVRDHGPGLHPDQMRQLERGDEGIAVGDDRGIGLGLLFVQRVARRHDGTLRAMAPTSGTGVAFELELPS